MTGRRCGTASRPAGPVWPRAASSGPSSFASRCSPGASCLGRAGPALLRAPSAAAAWPCPSSALSPLPASAAPAPSLASALSLSSVASSFRLSRPPFALSRPFPLVPEPQSRCVPLRLCPRLLLHPLPIGLTQVSHSGPGSILKEQLSSGRPRAGTARALDSSPFSEPPRSRPFSPCLSTTDPVSG